MNEELSSKDANSTWWSLYYLARPVWDMYVKIIVETMLANRMKSQGNLLADAKISHSNFFDLKSN